MTSPEHPSAPPSVVNVLSAISWLVLITVMYGGYSLLGLIGDLSPFAEQFFRAGHAHAGVLTAVSIVFVMSAARTNLSMRGQVIAYAVYLAGALLLSGSFFVHMALGAPGEGSLGVSVMAPAGALLLAGSMVNLAVRLFRDRPRVPVAA